MVSSLTWVSLAELPSDRQLSLFGVSLFIQVTETDHSLDHFKFKLKLLLKISLLPGRSFVWRHYIPSSSIFRRVACSHPWVVKVPFILIISAPFVISTTFIKPWPIYLFKVLPWCESIFSKTGFLLGKHFEPLVHHHLLCLLGKVKDALRCDINQQGLHSQ